MPRTSIKYLGIDFGSSSVSVIGYEDIGKEPIVFADSQGNQPWFATAMTPDAKIFFQSALKEDHFLESLKEDVLYDQDNKNLEIFMAKIFDTLSQCRSSSGEYDFSNLERICFGYPTYTPTCTQTYCEKLKNIIQAACNKTEKFNAPNVQIICAPEPELAAKGYNEANKNISGYVNSINDDDLLLVVDLGGYTLDMSILRASKTAENTVSLRPFVISESIESEGKPISMGKEITREICYHIYKDGLSKTPPKFDYAVEQQKCIFFSQGQNDTEPQPLKTQIPSSTEPKATIAKFILTKEQTGNPISVKNGECTVTVGIYSASDIFKGRSIYIGNTFNYCGDFINNYINVSLKSSQLGCKKISHVLFTGGTSRIGELCETIKNKLTQNTAYVSDPVKIWFVDSTPPGAMEIRWFDGITENETLSSINVVALGAATVAAKGEQSEIFGGYYAMGAYADDLKIKCELLSKRNAALEQMILDFCDKKDLCEDCQAKFAKLLEDMQYPC